MIVGFGVGFLGRLGVGEATLFADGGYQSSPVECIVEWTYKEKLADGGNEETSLTGCVDIDEFKPYPFFPDEIDSEIAALLEPSSSATVKTKWCPVLRDIYNPTPQKTPENKFNWGYCLDTSVSETDSPTNPPVGPPTDPPTSPPTDPPTSPPTDPPTDPPTNPPVDSPTNPPTNPPTRTEPLEPVASPVPVPVAPPQPTPSDSSPNEVDPVTGALSGDLGMIVGIIVAATLVAVALIMIVVFAQKMKSRKDDEIDDQADVDEAEDIHDIDIEGNNVMKS